MSDEALIDLAEHITESLKGAVSAHEMHGDELILFGRREDVDKILQFLRDDRECAFRQLLDITALDYPQREHRFDIVYQLLSVTQNQRISLKSRLVNKRRCLL